MTRAERIAHKIIQGKALLEWDIERLANAHLELIHELKAMLKEAKKWAKSTTKNTR